jgi:3-hydroxybutyryl-CoA dehydrogenase
MKVDDIRKILVVGTGIIAQKIALQCARFGYEVIAYNPTSKSLENAKAKIRAFAADLLAQQEMTFESSEIALSRIHYTSQPEDGADADLLSESVYEDPELKAKVFAQFNHVCQPKTIFTTNTSTLLPSMLAEATGRPEKFAAFHFYGVFNNQLIDIMPHAGTSQEVVTLLTAFAKRIKQVPLVFKREHPGYVANAIFGAMNEIALKIALVEKVASVEDVDRAVMLSLGMPCGPFGLNDQVGLDTLWRVMRSKAIESADEDSLRFTDEFKRDYLDKGWLGVKSGRGFYTYPDPAYLRPEFLNGDHE